MTNNHHRRCDPWEHRKQKRREKFNEEVFKTINYEEVKNNLMNFKIIHENYQRKKFMNYNIQCTVKNFMNYNE